MSRCRQGCCRNPWGVCGRRSLCDCHGDPDDQLNARQRWEDYIDSLGEE